jgi:catechol 2,3-dioxygenase-like lactoylglutathione lyase family enzyme
VTALLGLHHVQVAAPRGCETAARAFYGGLLGLPELEKPHRLAVRGGCWFALAGAELHVGVEDPFAPAGKAHPAFLAGSHEELERLARTLSDAGVAVTWADDAEIPGQLRFYVDDPWGNRLELVVGGDAGR